MPPRLTNLRQLLEVAITGLLLVLPVHPGYAQTGSAQSGSAPTNILPRNLTDADVAPAIVNQINHDSYEFDRPELLNEFRDHVIKTDYGLQKSSAHRFMAIRRRLQTKAEGSFNLIGDLAAAPEAYSGHPVIMFGYVEQVVDRSQSVGSRIFQATVLDTVSQQPIAVAEFPMMESDYEPLGLKPVMLCGYPIKFIASTNGTDRLPFVVAQRLEWVRPNLGPDDLRGVTHRSRGITETEADPYYETLKRARLQSNDTLRQVGQANRQRRVDELIENTKLQAVRLSQRAELHRSANPDDVAGYRQMMTQAEDYLRVNLRRYEKYGDAPEQFPLFADVFKNPDYWQGKMVTMTGRVRKVMKYPPNEDDFGLGVLHEIWLYTDHSQRNPAVFVCSSLPANFPTTDGTKVIDNVTITGYFFKLYRYTAEDAHRLAPMLLGQTATWNPQAGVTQEGIPGWLKTLGILGSLVGFFALMMYMANNSQQDRRFRKQVRDGNLRSDPLNLEIVDGHDADPFSDLSSGTSVDTRPKRGLPGSRSTPQHEQQPAVPERASTRTQVPTERFQPADDNWIGRERVIGQKIRTVLRLAPKKRYADDSGVLESPTIVVLKNGYRFELAESELRPAGPGVSTGDLQRMKQRQANKTEQFLGAEISNVLVDQLSNVYLILNGEQYLSVSDLPNDDSVRAPLLSQLFESREIAFADYWSQTPVSRSQLQNRGGQSGDAHLRS